MATDDTPDSGVSRTVSGLFENGVRIVADLIAVTCWVLLLTLLFLKTAWLESQLAFYVLLLVGIGGYVTLTAAWRNGDTR